MATSDITIPKKGIERKKVLSMLKEFSKADPDYKKLKTWSLVYYLGDEHTDFLLKAYAEYLSANGLNPMAFKSLKRLETEVVRMTANLLHGDSGAVGVMTSGGTESCLLAVKTYRDMGRAVKRIRRPEMVIPETAHVAWEKGAEYFGVKAVHAPLRKDYGVDVDAVRKLVNRNTVMILGSAPEYPHGIIDPIPELATQGGAAMYGMISHIPLRGMVKKTVLKMFADMYGPNAKMINPEGMSMEEESSTEKPDVATRLALWYLKIRERLRK